MQFLRFLAMNAHGNLFPGASHPQTFMPCENPEREPKRNPKHCLPPQAPVQPHDEQRHDGEYREEEDSGQNKLHGLGIDIIIGVLFAGHKHRGDVVHNGGRNEGEEPKR